MRAALTADEEAAGALAALRLTDSEEFEAGADDLRLLLDTRLLEGVKARQRELAAAAANDLQAREEFRRTQEQVRALTQRIDECRRTSASASTTLL